MKWEEEEEQQRLSEALRGLTERYREAEAPPRVEAAVLAAYRGARARPGRSWPGRSWPVWAAAAACVLLAVSVLRMARPPAVTAPAAPEVVTEFFPMSPGTDLNTLQPAGVVRVEVPRVTLAWYGLPMNPNRVAEPIAADVILDRHGVARAIRFVQ